MIFELCPDLDRIMDRFEAFWECKIIDRPMYSIVLWKNEEDRIQINYPDYKGNWEDRWLDVDFRVKEAETTLRNQFFLGDAIPFVMPGMGTDILAAATNCGYKFDGITGWSTHDLKEWKNEPQFSFDQNNKYYIKQMEFISKLMKHAKGKFIVSHPDYHPTGDQLAATRGTENALMDLILYPDKVKSFLERTQKYYYNMYDKIQNEIVQNGMPCISWTNVASKKSSYMICNDFSIMISKEMFDEFFLPYVIEESKKFNRSMYHLDGTGALHHLDSLLEIDTLNGIQFLPGTGAGPVRDYIDVFVKIQNAGKCLEILQPDLEDLEVIFKELKPEGVILNWISGVKDKNHAKQIEEKIIAWGKKNDI